MDLMYDVMETAYRLFEESYYSLKNSMQSMPCEAYHKKNCPPEMRRLKLNLKQFWESWAVPLSIDTMKICDWNKTEERMFYLFSVTMQA